MTKHAKPDQEQLSEKFTRLCNTIKDVGKKLHEAIVEEHDMVTNLTSVRQGTLDFKALEHDIARIHKQFERDGSVVLGSSLFLDDRKDLMEIRTYHQRNDKTFLNTIQVEVHQLQGCPADILAELKKHGTAEVSVLSEM